MSNQAANAIEQMQGIAIFGSPTDQHAQYVFSMGVLDSLLRFDSWHGDPLDRAPAQQGWPDGGVAGAGRHEAVPRNG